ncbi:MAG: DUF4091 domain-containing protein [Burkholderiaceae bacterium]
MLNRFITMARQAGIGLVWVALAAAAAVHAAGVDLQFANLHNPYFPDIAPGEARADNTSTYVVAPPPSRYVGIVGDTVPIPFTITSSSASAARIAIQLSDKNGVVASLPSQRQGPMALYRALDVRVEGNSNGSCSCLAGELPQAGSDGGGQFTCVKAASADEARTPKGCPAADERRKAQGTLVRSAPFAIKDALEHVADAAKPIHLERGTELFLVDVDISPEWSRRDLRLSVSVTPEGGDAKTVTMPLHVTALQLENFPSLDLSYWISEDPRDLVARPIGAALNAAWGGDWWSAEHWSHIEQAAQLQARLGVTNTLVPLFVKNPAGLAAKPLVPTRCISGSKLDLKALSARSESFNDAVATWSYDFDFAGFKRWIGIFKAAGFKRFEGAHLFANGGRLPSVLECDVYASTSDREPYARGFRFLPRTLSSAEAEASQRAREAIYRDKFLPPLLQGLAKELTELGLAGRYLQHVIDENDSSDEALEAYANGAKAVHKYLPGVGTIDAINKYSAPRYSSLVDLPVVHLILIYDDQDRRKGIRKEVEEAFPGRKYFYNTALRAGGPNRFLDTNPLESRVHGWLALETGYTGFLYWASNMYRYPTAADVSGTKRASDWSPFSYSQGPRPGGAVEPAYGAGGNWILYPSPAGLTDSLRARRLRDGLLDHWMYMHAWSRCSGGGLDACRAKLLALRARLTKDNHTIADFSRNPRDYDEAREAMLAIIEP